MATATTTPRARLVAKIVAIGLGVMLAIAAVLGSSRAAFSAQTEPNHLNNWAAGVLIMTLDDVNQAIEAPLFSFGIDGVGRPKSGAQLKQYLDTHLTSQGITSTIDIRYTGNVDADVRMFVKPGFTADGNLAQNTLVTVTRAVGGGTPQPVFTNIPLANLPTNWGAAGGSNSWQVDRNSDVTATYTVTIKATAAAENTTAFVKGVEFVWEAQQR
jgi:hypothetical protein